MRNTLFFLFYAGILFLTSCEKDETPDKTAVITITETSHASDDPTLVTHTERYYYSKEKLVTFSNMQHYNNDIIINNSTLNYFYNGLHVYDESGNVLIYMADSFNVVLCNFSEPGTDNERSYHFSYDENGYLCNLEEILDSTINRNITLTYNDSNLISITTQTFYDNIPETSTRLYTTSQQLNTDNLPFIPILEEYPLYFHKAAFYARMMGRALKYLPESSYYEENPEEKVQYSYTRNAKGQLSSLTSDLLINGKSLQKRTFNYSYE